MTASRCSGVRPAELDHDLAAAERGRDRRPVDRMRDEAVEIGLAGNKIFVETLALPFRAACVGHELERSGSEHIGLREFRILRKFGRRVEAVIGAREYYQHRAVGLLQLEHDGQRIGSFDGVDIGEVTLPDRDRAALRVAKPFVGRLDVGRCQWRSIMEQDVGAQLERIGEIVGGDLPGVSGITDDIGIICRVDS